MHVLPLPAPGRGAAALAVAALALAASATGASPATAAVPAPVQGSTTTVSAPVRTGPAAGNGAAAPAVAPAAADTAATWSVAPADNRIGVGRPHFTYTLPQGTRVTDAITVANRGDAPITLRIYASDAFTTASGALDLLPAGEEPTDVGAWTVPRAGTVTLAPQQQRTVPFTVTVPSDAAPGDHTGGLVTSLVTKDGAGKVGLDRRLGARIYLRVPGVLTPALKVSALHTGYDGTANPVGSGSARITYTVTNSGNVRVTAGQKVRVRALFGALTGTTALPALPELLPGDSLTRTAVVHGVPPAGPLRVTVSLDPKPVGADGAAGQQPATAPVAASASDTLWAWPWAALLAAAVLALLVYAGVLLRRRGRRKVAEAVEKALGDALSGA
ncbi:hypothetical protein RVR_2596 [Actinacidiphila reveromycinica]|uniref:WxL Interacting Protein peptidoglycan binding domain-containing protein n=1 Tax=Actinacidiphila reveromycinica TaxID=659352 RepID=A0A7U3UQQ0_9ACTN|nr:DUF916 domain-containing protein [Streptomyces sp. SN-593]BBA97037.1 hypothetical protein RVR_2596 [Streptomyces sp. SN-593]